MNDTEVSQTVQKPKIVAIVGPTASGKSDLAVQIAEQYNGEIISADSRQVYRGLDIGSGKITQEEMRGIPHHLLDVAGPKETFTASDFKELGEKALHDILSRGKLPIVAGGTGFYIDVLLGKVVLPSVPPNEKLRNELEEKTREELLHELSKLDQARFETLTVDGTKRKIIRAIEIAHELGSVPQKTAETPYDVLTIGIEIDRTKLKEKVHARLIKRLNEGMVEEVERLHKNGVSWERLESLGLEYQYLALFLQEKISQEEMMQEIESKSLQYARRQMTWFRRDKDTKWFKLENREDIFKAVKDFLN